MKVKINTTWGKSRNSLADVTKRGFDAKAISSNAFVPREVQLVSDIELAWRVGFVTGRLSRIEAPLGREAPGPRTIYQRVAEAFPCRAYSGAVRHTTYPQQAGRTHRTDMHAIRQVYHDVFPSFHGIDLCAFRQAFMADLTARNLPSVRYLPEGSRTGRWSMSHPQIQDTIPRIEPMPKPAFDFDFSVLEERMAAAMGLSYEELSATAAHESCTPSHPWFAYDTETEDFS
jgi:hypothetical protein